MHAAYCKVTDHCRPCMLPSRCILHCKTCAACIVKFWSRLNPFRLDLAASTGAQDRNWRVTYLDGLSIGSHDGRMGMMILSACGTDGRRCGGSFAGVLGIQGVLDICKDPGSCLGGCSALWRHRHAHAPTPSTTGCAHPETRVQHSARHIW
jgi:hypothetical protein